MQKYCPHFLEKPKLSCLFLFLFLLGQFFSQAQTDLAAGTDWQKIAYSGNYQEFKVPDNFTGLIYFRMFGGDGGFAKGQLEDCIGKGGSGAEVYQELVVGNGANEIPAGSPIRFIVGGKGESHSTNGGGVWIERDAGGGGGTGIVAKIRDQWTILSVAGGGGGGYAKVFNGICATATQHGRSANTAEDGSGLDGKSNGPSGGTDGGGGEGGYENDSYTGGGGGYKTDGHNAWNEDDSGKAGWSNYAEGTAPEGGAGATHGAEGGFGFGGGGASGSGAGGGGGYSGGGGGKDESAGGGGGSWINHDYSKDYYIRADPTTDDPKDGFVQYRLEWKCFVEIETLTVDQPENCASQGATVTVTLDQILPCATDLNYDLYDITNPDAPKYLALSYDGEFDDVDYGEYAIVVGNVAYGPMDTATFVVNVQGDETFPTAVCQDITVTLEEDGTYVLEPEEVDGGSTDNCGINRFFLLSQGETGLSQLTLSCEQVGDPTFDVGLAVTDHANLTSICVAKVIVLDGTSPSLPDNMQAAVYLDASGQYTLKEEDISHIEGTDLCADAVDLSYTIDAESATYTCADIGQTVTTKLTVSDPAGNTGIGNLSITVLDNIPASIVCQDVTIDLSDEGTASINHLDFIVSANDNCLTEAEIISSYSWDTNLLPSTVNCAHIGQHDIVLAGSTDINGNVLPKCSGTLTVRDVSAPTIVCRDTIIYIDQDNSAFTVETLPIESVIDACFSPDELSYTWKKTTSFTCANLGSDENFWIEVKDPYDNTSSCTFTLTVLDTTALGVTCRGMTVNLLPSTGFSYTLRPTDIYNGLSSVCNSLLDHPGTLSFPEDFDPLLDCEEAGTSQTVTLIYTPDDGSPATSCTSTVKIHEEFRPKITCPTGIIDLQGTYEDCGALYEYEYTAWDNECPEEVEVSITEGLPSGSIFPIGWNDMVIRVWDKSGNTTACSFVVKVAPPSERPTLECPENYTITLAEDACNTIIDTTAIFHQTCVVQNRQYLGPTMGSTFELGSYTFGFSTRNTETNLSSSCTFTVSVDKDNKNPVAICKDSTVVLTNGQVEIDPAAFDGGSYDNCYTLNKWTLFEGPFANRIFNCSDLGEKDFKLRVYNSIGAWSECDTRITFVLEDLECQDISVSLDETGTAVIAPEDIFVSDGACTNQYSIQIDQTSFDCSALGDNLVTLTRTAPDDTQQCTAHVSVTVAENDITPPVALCIPDTTVYVGHDWTLFLDPATIDAGSYDIAGCEVNNNISLQLSDDVFFCADIGPYEYFLTVSDANGNQSTCSTVITMADTLGPEIIHCRDISIELDAGGSYSLIISDIEEAFQTREVCLSAPNDYSQVQFNFDCTDLGQTIPMTVIGRDSHGNTSECDFSVTVNAEATPTPVCQDITVTLDETGTAVITPEDIFVSDDVCTSQYSIEIDQTTFDCSNLGDNLVTLTRLVPSPSGQCTAIVTVDNSELAADCSSQLLIKAKVLLEGPYDSASGLMNDDLRSLDLIPSTEPYGKNGETVARSVLSVSGSNAIVDWVLLQLRDENDPTEILYERAALLQRDGDIVDLDGINPVSFNAGAGQYFVAIKHRNHMGCLSSSTSALSSTATFLDFTASSMSVYGNNSRTELKSGIWGLYGADVDGSGDINASDRSMTWNDRNKAGYLNSDCNLDGATNASDRSSAWNNRNLGGTMPD